ncbi:MAG: alpha-amylase family glycosyl hydrolase, partial [Anaerolineaceae bacterium]|nr:alpha-amylase family glycosyl hydrolase [Anaerolineaceae bacterium]
RYKIGAYCACEDTWIYTDNQADNFSEGTHYSIWFNDVQLPEWSKKAKVYQIFVDRFNPGVGKEWLQKSDLQKPFGGTLRGIIEKLDYISALGFDALWLTPIFESPSHHGYDISDYYKINPRFGTKADFDDLIEKAHIKGIRIILDFVANHCSDQNELFLDARSSLNSQYHDWFIWNQWPDDYKSFFNVKEMPEFNLAYGQPARKYLLECAQYWLGQGVDGFRLDYAHGPEQDFWVDFRQTCRQEAPQCWTFGELVQPALEISSYEGGLDGSLDFHLCRALRLTFAQKSWPLSRLAGMLKSHWDYFGQDFSLPAFIDNHDMNRFLIPANGDERYLKIALMFLYFLSAPPVVYYGTEIGLSQNKSIHSTGGLGFDEARLPMDWNVTSELSAYIARLAELRRKHPVIFERKEKIVRCDDERQTLVMSSGEGKQRLWLLVNRSELSRNIKLENLDVNALRDGINDKKIKVKNCSLSIELEPVSSIWLIPG